MHRYISKVGESQPANTRNRKEFVTTWLTAFLVSDPSRVLDQLEIVRQKKDCCMVIDGQSLETCLLHHENIFMDIAVHLPAVVACRCSPTQKADVTRLISSYTGRRTCAIGDGGNDVS